MEIRTMFIAILTYKKPLGEVDRFLAAHREIVEFTPTMCRDDNMKQLLA